MIELKKLDSFDPNNLDKPLFDSLSNPARDSDNSNTTIGKNRNRYLSISTPSPFKLINLPPKKKSFAVQLQTKNSAVQDFGQPETFKEGNFADKRDQGTAFVYNNYDVLDLTFSLIDCNLSLTIMATLFFIQVAIRYFSIISMIYMMVETRLEYWEWILTLFFTYIIYCISIVKISLKFPQTQSQYILKQSFNSLQQNDNLEFFQVIDAKRFGMSILRGITPPEFSFIYIKNLRTNVKNFHVYVMINYIYNSIQAFVYYPFYLTYTILVYYNNILAGLGWIYPMSYLTVLLSEFIFVSLSIYLLLHGCKKKGYLSIT